MSAPTGAVARPRRTSRSSGTLDEAQRAMLTLLSQPLLTAGSHPREFQLVLSQRQQVSSWASRLGYRLSFVGQAIRLHRIPLAGTVAVPPPPAPVDRRDLVVVVLAAMAAEEADGITTTQMLSDTVRLLSTTLAVVPYDPDSWTERRKLLRALGRLEQLGVLRRRTFDETELAAWEDGSGVGAGYEVLRDAQLSLVDPQVVELALPRRRAVDTDEQTAEVDPGSVRVLDVAGHEERGYVLDEGVLREDVDGASFADPAARLPEGRSGEAPRDPVRDPTTYQRLLRLLLETPALVYAELDSADAVYARAQAARLAAAATEMTGGTVEMRTEGMVLVLDADSPVGSFVDWPRPGQPHQLSLRLLDAVLTDPDSEMRDGRLHVPWAVVERQSSRLHALLYAQLNRDVKVNPPRLQRLATDALLTTGQLRLTSAGWHLSAPLGRFRDAEPDADQLDLATLDAPVTDTLEEEL